jgi:hypothetical protein
MVRRRSTVRFRNGAPDRGRNSNGSNGSNSVGGHSGGQLHLPSDVCLVDPLLGGEPPGPASPQDVVPCAGYFVTDRRSHNLPAAVDLFTVSNTASGSRPGRDLPLACGALSLGREARALG